MQIVKKRYHPGLTAGVDLPEAITQMAEVGPCYLCSRHAALYACGSTPIGVLIPLVISIVISAGSLWGHAKQRNLPVSTELRLMKLAFRMRKIIRVRAREEKAKIKAEKKRKRGK